MGNLQDSQEFAWKAVALGAPLLTIVAWVRRNHYSLGDGTSIVEAIGPPCGGKSECRKDEDEAAIAAFAVEHRVAAICHFCVATFKRRDCLKLRFGPE